MRTHILAQKMLQISGGAIGTVTDALLYLTFHTLTLTGVRTMAQADLLLKDINHKTIAKAIKNLIAQGLIQQKGNYSTKELAITAAGIKRINELFPTYKTQRLWDGYIYLISYDIPSTSNAKRNLFRQYLRKIGCGLLQESLWMTPYNPHGIVETFVTEHAIPGTILISKLGHDGSIGDENLTDLINRVYHLSDLNKKYEAFIETYSHQKHPSKTELSLAYYTILKDDPQLPFPLEPKGFGGKDAHELVKQTLTKLVS